MESPAVHFFSKSLPNVSVIRDDQEGHLEMRWKENDGKESLAHADMKDLHASLLRRMSTAHSDCSAFPYFGGLDFSSKTGISWPFSVVRDTGQ